MVKVFLGSFWNTRNFKRRCQSSGDGEWKLSHGIVNALNVTEVNTEKWLNSKFVVCIFYTMTIGSTISEA